MVGLRIRNDNVCRDGFVNGLQHKKKSKTALYVILKKCKATKKNIIKSGLARRTM